jgi:hypothetical protein
MSEFGITQKQIDALLHDISIKDRVGRQYDKIDHKLARMRRLSDSAALSSLQEELYARIRSLETEPSYSPAFISAFKTEFSDFSRKALRLTREYPLFELLVALEGMIGAMLYRVDRERRRYPRFPLPGDLSLIFENESYSLSGGDISSVGISFFGPVRLPLGGRYALIPSGTLSLWADVLRITPMAPEELGIFQTVCAFPNLLPWDRIRDIIIASLENF